MEDVKPGIALAAAAAGVTACGGGAAAHTTAAAPSRAAAQRPAACAAATRAVSDIAGKAGISLTAGTWNGTVTRSQKLQWAAELGGSYTPAAAPTAGDARLQEKIVTARLDLLNVTGNASAQAFIHDLQEIQATCAG